MPRSDFRLDAFSAQDVASGHRIIQMGVEPVQIHVMSDISGVWDEVWAGRVGAHCGSHDVAFIGRNQFLANKKASGRPQDLADVHKLEGDARCLGASGARRHSQFSVQSVSDVTSFTKIRLPENAGCAQVSVSATL